MCPDVPAEAEGTPVALGHGGAGPPCGSVRRTYHPCARGATLISLSPARRRGPRPESSIRLGLQPIIIISGACIRAFSSNRPVVPALSHVCRRVGVVYSGRARTSQAARAYVRAHLLFTPRDVSVLPVCLVYERLLRASS